MNNENLALAELSITYDSAYKALKRFKNACEGVFDEKSSYKKNNTLLNLIPNLTEVYIEYESKVLEKRLTENEF